jgi:hypothetical protein
MRSTRSRQAAQVDALRKDGVVKEPGIGVAATLAGLQRSAGNRAVSAMIARDEKKEPEPGAAVKTLAMPDPIGTLELLSYTRSGGQGINVIVRSSAADPLLMRAATNGQLFDQVTIEYGYITITLKSVAISHAARTSDDAISLSLNFATEEQDYTKKEEKGAPVTAP